MVEFIVADWPLQIVAFPAVITGRGLTIILADVLALTHPAGDVYTKL